MQKDVEGNRLFKPSKTYDTNDIARADEVLHLDTAIAASS